MINEKVLGSSRSCFKVYCSANVDNLNILHKIVSRESNVKVSIRLSLKSSRKALALLKKLSGKNFLLRRKLFVRKLFSMQWRGKKSTNLSASRSPIHHVVGERLLDVTSLCVDVSNFSVVRAFFHWNWKCDGFMNQKEPSMAAKKRKCFVDPRRGGWIRSRLLHRVWLRRPLSMRSRKLLESAWTLPSSIVTLSIDFSEEQQLSSPSFSLIEENFAFPSSSEKNQNSRRSNRFGHGKFLKFPSQP